MALATTVTRAMDPARVVEAPGEDFKELPATNSTTNSRRRPTDDEILGIEADETALRKKARDASRSEDGTADATPGATTAEDKNSPNARDPENLQATLDANPELRQAWQDVQAYREAFATPEQARTATAQLADLSRMDALFYSRRPEDHAELARLVAELDPAAFASLAEAMGRFAADAPSRERAPRRTEEASRPAQVVAENNREMTQEAAPTTAQKQFFQTTNAEAVQSVIDSIETQVERLLPEKISKSARNRVVGEIYRELDATLQTNPQFTRQIREAVRTGALDAAHRRAIVSLIAGRARQALPAVAKRVLNEWTSTVVAASQDRRERQRTAERRVDIAGSSGGSEGRRTLGPRDVDYTRMSDADILNL